MVRYLLHRIGRTVAVLAGVTALLYLAVELQPGSVDAALCGDEGCSAAIRTEIEATYATDAGVVSRAASFATAALTLDFGPSLTEGGRDAVSVVTAGVGASVSLALVSLAVALLLLAGVVLLDLVADRPGVRLGIVALSTGALVVPLFWLGTVVRAVTGPGLLPAAFVLALGGTSLGVRRVHERVRSGLDADHVRMARTYGVPEPRIRLRHGVRPAVPPALVSLAGGLGVVLGGLILLEPVFDRAGIGAEIASALSLGDRPVVLAGVYLLIVSFVVGRSLLLIVARASEPPRTDRWALL